MSQTVEILNENDFWYKVQIQLNVEETVVQKH